MDTKYWENAYVVLGVEFDATISDRPNEIYHLYNARRAIVDLISTGQGSEVGIGTEAEVDLLYQMDLLYRQARNHFSYDPWRDGMVTSINNFSVRYFGDLTEFVNSLGWPDDCIPFYWAALSEKGGVDTTGWNICS